MSSKVTTVYEFLDVSINDTTQMRNFLFSHVGTKGIPIYWVTYDEANKLLRVQTKEPAFSTSTQNTLHDAIINKYPNPPISTTSNLATMSTDATVSQSVYGYFPQTTSVDGNAVMVRNTSLTRNMYYSNLTVNAGVTLNTNGWRLVVTNTLLLNGTISNDGSDASGIIAGTGTAPMYTTYLGPGTSGGAGLSNNGSGNPGVSASYQCSGGVGGAGGAGSGIYSGGAAGALLPISAVDGGMNTLSTMPTAFLGRMISSNYYIMGGTGGGGGGCSKGNATTVRSGAGGGAGGLMIIAAKTVEGSGMLSAKGGNGSSATWSGSGTQIPGGLGGGGGGGGGCIIVITQGTLPETISFNVSGGSGGSGVAPGGSGSKGSDGNIFVLSV